MENVVGCVLMAAIAFPVSFFMARGCLQGFMRQWFSHSESRGYSPGPGKRNVL